MNCTLRDTLSGSPVEIKELKSALVSIPREIRDMIYSYLLVNPVLRQAASVSSETNYSSTQKHDLGTAILYVYCSNSPGDSGFRNGVSGGAGCLEDEEDQQIPVIPDYCYYRDQRRKLWPTDLSVPYLPSPELISEYSKLTSGATPIIECVGLLGERLKVYFWLFHRAEFVVINRTFAGLRRSIRVHDISIRPPEAVSGGLVTQEDEQSFLDCGELVGAIEDPSLEHTGTAEDVLRFKQYRGELFKVLEHESQNVRACSIKFREFLQSKSGPTGVFVIGPSRAVDRLDYWTRVTRAMEVLEEYEYSFAKGKTEKLRLSLAEKNKGSHLDTHSDVVEAIVWPKPESNAQRDRGHIIEISRGETSDEDLQDSICLGDNGDGDEDDGNDDASLPSSTTIHYIDSAPAQLAII
ncbi:hypothetical protein BCON_0452g00010 [Botryotinia convoluta]|uniref:Uncharacterized protein n=1 Tax=Botryotinia convoluta TaxID=54673 RepID=A0A4Z1H861_9HELO|nr:hypothetical protein BCON_0452g00010 [Botryotinia convoluta]